MDGLMAVVLGAEMASGPAVSPLDSGTAAVAKAVVAGTDTMNARQYDERTRFSRTHPNELWRLYGSDAAAHGDWNDAMKYFRQAARYGDKYSQHRISLLYWHGVGVERDPALAYAWADLAAERMYPNFLVLREKMWEHMDPSERDRALREGQALYDEYGDAAAKPRLKRALAHEKRQITGSRTGYVGTLEVSAPDGGIDWMAGIDNIDMTAMYNGWRWDTGKYWAVEDAIWTHGNVEVGPVSNGDD